jgi:hypothetical protein
VFLWRAIGPNTQERAKSGIVAEAEVIGPVSSLPDNASSVPFWHDPTDAGQPHPRVLLRLLRVAQAFKEMVHGTGWNTIRSYRYLQRCSFPVHRSCLLVDLRKIRPVVRQFLPLSAHRRRSRPADPRSSTASSPARLFPVAAHQNPPQPLGLASQFMTETGHAAPKAVRRVTALGRLRSMPKLNSNGSDGWKAAIRVVQN